MLNDWINYKIRTDFQQILFDLILYTIFKSFMSNPFISHFLVITLLLCSVNSNQIVDFTYSQLTALSSGFINHPKVQISPDKSIFQNYDFPEACKIHTLLNQLQKNVQDKFQMSNIGDYLNGLKQKFTLLLKASQKIKNLQKFINNLPEIKQDANLVISQKQLANLLQKQRQLIEIQNKIYNRTLELEKLVLQSMKRTQNPLFEGAALNFQQKSLQAKLKLLKKILEQAQNKALINNQQKNIRLVQDYFGQLKKIFDNQNVLLENLFELLQNYNELSLIKAKISNLNSQIQAHTLIIAQKQTCQAQVQVIRNKQKNHQEIQELMRLLRTKKIQMGNTKNQYCEGVVKKLIDRVTKLLASYDIAFMCSEGKDQLVAKKIQFKEQLQAAQKKLKQLEDRQKIDQFKQKFYQNRQEVNKKINQVSIFKQNQFTQSPQQIQITINKTQEKLQQIKKKMEELQNSSQKIDKSQLFDRLQRLIIELKTLKNLHCTIQSQYEEISRIIYEKLYALQQQTQYNLNIQNIHFQKINELRMTETQLKAMQKQLLQILKSS